MNEPTSPFFSAHASDPDFFYHLGVARFAAENHTLVPQTLTPIQGIGWDQAFPEKEFFFHLITNSIYRLWGQTGLHLFPYILCLILVLTLSLYAKRRRVSFGLGILVTTLSLIAHPWLFGRYTLLRPHNFAVLLFVGLAISLSAKRSKATPFLVGGFSILFCLAYHAYYLPLLLLVWGALSKRLAIKTTAYLFLATLSAIVLNPYFPGNLLSMWIHLRIATHDLYNSGLNYGGELYPWVSTQLFKVTLLPLLTLLGALLWGAGWFRKSKGPVPQSFFFGPMLGFVGLSFFSPRAIEFLTPISVLWFFDVLGAFRYGSKKTALICLIAIQGILPRLNETWSALKGRLDFDPRMIEERQAQYKNLQINPGDKIFNVEWDSSPYILAARRDLPFIDILDPSFLAHKNKDLSDMRISLTAGQIPDPALMLYSTTGANWLSTRNSIVIGQLRRDPFFIEIKDPKPVSERHAAYDALFKVNPNHETIRKNHFVTKIQYSLFDPKLISESDLSSLSPDLKSLKPIQTPKVDGTDSKFLPLPTLYFDFFKEFKSVYSESKSQLQPQSFSCATVAVPTETATQMEGSEVLGVGGGRSIKLWFNNEPLYDTVGGPPQPMLIYQLVKLPRPFRPNDRLTGVVCSQLRSGFFGLTLSHFKKEDVRELCRKKSETAGSSSPSTMPVPKINFPQTGTLDQTCLGVIAKNKI